jgi:hypothetical protein
LTTNIDVYFCDPQGPWQRGSNENTNALLRQHFPKGTDLSVHSQAYLNKVAPQLNERPCETLQFETPAERFNACRPVEPAAQNGHAAVVERIQKVRNCRGSAGVGGRQMARGRPIASTSRAFHRREDRMNKLVIAFIAIAVTQALQLLLTIVREREVKRLRKLVVEQSIFIQGWLMAERVHSGQPAIIADREPIADDTGVPEPAIAPEDLPETIQLRTTEDEAAQFGQADAGGSHPSGQWPIEDLQRYVARLRAGAPPEPAIPEVPEPAATAKDLPDTTRPSTVGDELERATKAINWLKEDADKAREIGVSLPGTPAEKKIG